MISKKPKRNVENQNQIERFKEAARQLEADDDEKRFDEKLKRLAKQKPQEESDD